MSEFVLSGGNINITFLQKALDYSVFSGCNVQRVVHRDKSTGIVHDGQYAYIPLDEGKAVQVGVIKMTSGKITNVQMFSDATDEHKKYIANLLAKAKSRSRSN